MKNLLLTICALFFSIATAKTIAGTQFPCKKIKQALLLAVDGDTILVYKGTYKEGNILISKKIVFLGKDFPTLDGQQKHEVVSISADSVIVKGFRIINSGYASLDDPCGIKVYDRTFIKIENNILDNNFFGIYLQNCRNCLVKNNKITAYGKQEQLIGNGIHCWKSDNLQIIANKISGHRDGIYFNL
jgi:nitrous oxidase accessory protein